MPARLSPPTEETFDLPKTDEHLKNDGDPTTVTIRQASQGQHDQRSTLWAKFDKKFSLDEGMDQVTISQEVSPADVRREEVYLTMVDCNLLGPDGKPLFEFPLTRDKFKRAWVQLPPIVAEEIHEKVLSVNPTWVAGGGL